MAGLVAPRRTDKNFFKKNTWGIQALCLLAMAMMGLVAPMNREENKKKSKKAPPLLVMTASEALASSCTQKHKKKNKKRGAEASPPPAPLTTAAHEASPPNYAHKYKKVKKSQKKRSRFSSFYWRRRAELHLEAQTTLLASCNYFGWLSTCLKVLKQCWQWVAHLWTCRDLLHMYNKHTKTTSPLG